MLALGLFGVLNTLLVAGLAGYLAATDRLDRRRAQEVRALFAETISERTAREEREAREKADRERALAETARRMAPPVTADERIEAERASVRVEEQRLRRFRDEVEMLRATLMQEREMLDRRRAAFEKELASATEQARAREQMERSAQFKKAVGVLQSVKPQEARALLMGVIERGETPQAAQDPGGLLLAANTRAATPVPTPAPVASRDARIDLVVSYLNAMQERTRAKVIGEFLKDDPALASELLERLRRRGQIAGAAEVQGR
jgi:hypothetical protein